MRMAGAAEGGLQFRSTGTILGGQGAVPYPNLCQCRQIRGLTTLIAATAAPWGTRNTAGGSTGTRLADIAEEFLEKTVFGSS